MHLGSGRGGASSRGSRYTPHAGAAAASPVGATQQRTQLLPASAAAAISHQPCAGGAIDRDLAGLRAPKLLALAGWQQQLLSQLDRWLPDALSRRPTDAVVAS